MVGNGGQGERLVPPYTRGGKHLSFSLSHVALVRRSLILNAHTSTRLRPNRCAPPAAGTPPTPTARTPGAPEAHRPAVEHLRDVKWLVWVGSPLFTNTVCLGVAEHAPVYQRYPHRHSIGCRDRTGRVELPEGTPRVRPCLPTSAAPSSEEEASIFSSKARNQRPASCGGARTPDGEPPGRVRGEGGARPRGRRDGAGDSLRGGCLRRACWGRRVLLPRSRVGVYWSSFWNSLTYWIAQFVIYA